MDEKLNFPIFKEPLPEPRHLTMDEYLAFVEQCLELFPKSQDPNHLKEREPVNVMFKL